MNGLRTGKNQPGSIKPVIKNETEAGAENRKMIQYKQLVQKAADKLK